MLSQQSVRNPSVGSRRLSGRVLVFSVAWVLAFAVLPSAGYSQSVDNDPRVQQRLKEVEALKQDLLRKMQNLDNRMQALEDAEAKRQKSKTAKSDAKAAPGPQQPEPQTVAATNPPANPGVSAAQAAVPPAKAFPLVSPTNFNVGPFNVKVFGRANLDVIYNTARPQAPGTPFFLVPTFLGGFPQNTIDLNARQSMLGVTFTGPMIGDFQTGGRVSAVFFDNTILADRNGFLLQQSYGELYNENWRFAAGLQFDVFAPGFPTVLPFSGLGGSGSAGNSIKGQIRVERFVPVGNDFKLTLQVALSEPQGTYSIPDTSLDEDNGKPNLEGRIALGLGKKVPLGIGLLTQHPLEVGVSGVVGQLRRTAIPPDVPRRVVSDVWGAAIDFRANLAELFGLGGNAFGLAGKVYTGQALGNYNGGILQTLDAVTWKPIRTTGGWLEGFVYWTPNLHSHGGYAVDDPNDADITPIPNNTFGRTYNSTIWSNLIWDLDKSYRVAFEATYRRTEYKEPTNLPNKGYGFHTQFQWKF